MASLTIDALLELWLADLQANDLASGTVRRYKSAIESFFAWYAQEEQRHLTLEQLSPITLIGYRNFLQRTQKRATSTVNGLISALRTWCAWLTEEHYLETNPAKRIKLVGRQEASSREGLSPNQVNTLLRQVQSTRDAARNYAIV
jgi:site-specific recombinase XerD